MNARSLVAIACAAIVTFASFAGARAQAASAANASALATAKPTQLAAQSAATSLAAPTPIPSSTPSPASSSASSASSATSPTPSARPNATALGAAASPAASSPPLIVRGQFLTRGSGYVVLSSGQALRLGAGVVVPQGTALGSELRISLDRTTHEVVAIQPDAPGDRNPAIGATVDQAYVAGTSAAAPSGVVEGGAEAPPPSGPIAVTLSVTVPANTPPTDDVYVATDRSNFNPAEIRMQRVSSRVFAVSLSVPPDTRVRYEFTRGTYATVERDRSGGIVDPHALLVTSSRTIDDIVVRWADLD